MLRLSMADEALIKNIEYILAVELAPDMDRQAFPGVFVNDAQHAKRSAVMGSIHHEVITPDMVRRPSYLPRQVP